MNCPNCGFLLPDDSKFCQYCGTVLSGNAPGNEPAHTSAGTEPAHAAAAPGTVPPGAVQNAPAYAAPPAAQAPAPVPAPVAPVPAAPAYAAQPGAQQPRKGKKIKQCKACGADIDPHTKKCTACGKPASRVQPAALALAAVSVLLIFSLAINLFPYRSAVQTRQKLESSNATITAQESAILQLENQLEKTEEEYQRTKAQLLSAETKLKLSQDNAHNFSLIRSFLTKPDAGYASDQFYASTSVLLLSTTGGSQTFSLTTGFSGSGEISLSTTGSSASIHFTEDSWYDRTTIRVVPKSTGATYITFSNTLNSQTFRVLVIVT